MVATPGFAEMLKKLQGTRSYLGSKDFTASVLAVYKQMGQLVPELGLKN